LASRYELPLAEGRLICHAYVVSAEANFATSFLRRKVVRERLDAAPAPTSAQLKNGYTFTHIPNIPTIL
jgi:hypothetical protein